MKGMLRELRFANSRALQGSSRNVRHDQPVRHARLEMLKDAGLSSRHSDRQRLAVCHAKLDDIGAVVLRTVDHDAVLAARRSYAHLRRPLPQSSSASRFTARAWVKHSPPKRSRNASAMAASG